MIPAEAPSSVIHLEPAALFAKLDGTSDYAWQSGPDRLPRGGARLLEVFGQHAASSRAQLALLFQADVGRAWLARTLTGVVDAVGRLSPAVEVLRVVESEVPTPELCLRLTSAALSWRTPVHTEPFACEPPPILREALALDPEDELRSRLGLPLSLTPLQALELVRRLGSPWRYRGICYAWYPAGGCAPWLSELSPYLCVNFEDPPADPEVEALLRPLRENEPTAAEWEALDRLPVNEVRRGLVWLAAGAASPSPVRGGDPLALLVVAHLRRAADPGPCLLDAVVASAGSEIAGQEALTAAAPDLSTAAIGVLAAALTGDAPALDREVAEELAKGGYLGSETGSRISFDRWAVQAAESESVALVAVERLTRLGMAPEEARFLLDLPAHEGGTQVPEPTAAEIVARLGLPAPRQRVLAALAQAVGPVPVERLAAVAQTFPGWGEAFGRALTAGGAGAELSEDDLLAIAGARQRALGDGAAWRGVLAGLVRRGETERARALFARLKSIPGLAPPAELAAVIAARLEAGPPAVAPLPSILAPLVKEGLARSVDVTIAQEDGSRVPLWARLWSETTLLAELFEGVGGGPLPPVPPGWREAVRQGLLPERLARWLTAAGLPRSVVVAWAAEVLELPPQGLQALLDGDIDQVSGEVAVRARSWFAALAARLSRPESLRALAGQVRLGLFQGDEGSACDLVHALLPQDAEPGQELALHALCRIGPMPQLDGVAPDLAVAVTPGLEPVDLVDAAFRMAGTELTSDPDWLEAVAVRVGRSGAACPGRGYLKRQVRRHAVLAARLSALPGWEQLTPDRPIRERLALKMLRLLGVQPEDLVAPPRPANPGHGAAPKPAQRRRS